LIGKNRMARQMARDFKARHLNKASGLNFRSKTS